MILSNTAIFEALDDGRLSIDPAPAPRTNTPGGDKSPFDRTAIDLHLAPYYSVPRHAPNVDIDIARPGFTDTLEALTDYHDIPPEGYLLQPSSFVLSQTLEIIHLRLPDELEGDARNKPILAARVEGLSSLARFGLLVHFTAPTVQAGFRGRLTLEIICLGRWPLRLKPGAPICQLIIEHVDGVPAESEGQFDGQMRPSGAR